MSVLDEIVDGVRADLAERETATPLAEVKEAARRAPEAIDPMPAFRADGVSVIAEVKRSSPSKGASPRSRTRPSWPPTTRPVVPRRSACSPSSAGSVAASPT